jgi:hypothetical protein
MEERKAMNESTYKQLRCAFLILAMILLGLGVLPGTVHAAVVCATASPLADADQDGLSDADECSAITLADNTRFLNCASSGLPRPQCVDPDTKDLFFILIKANPTNIPAATFPNPLELLAVPVATGGLGVTPHEVTLTQAPNRNVTPKQKAVQITEVLSTADGFLGIGDWGGPNADHFAQIFTQRIKNCVNTAFATGKCSVTVSPAGVDHPEVYVPYIKQVLAHEVSHVLVLKKLYTARYGGYHNKTGSGFIMDQSATYSTQGGVTFNIPTKYNTAIPDPPDACFTVVPLFTTNCLPLQ